MKEKAQTLLDNIEYIAAIADGYQVMYGKDKPSRIVSDLDVFSNDKFMFEVRLKTRLVNGIECPAPLDTKPNRGDTYFIEDIGLGGRYYCSYSWENDPTDNLLFEVGNCYYTKEAAEASCKARWNI